LFNGGDFWGQNTYSEYLMKKQLSDSGKTRATREHSSPVAPVRTRRESNSSTARGPTRPGYWVMGRNAVSELLRATPERVLEIWCTPDSAPLIKSLKFAAPVHSDTDRQRLTALIGSESHQGIAAWVAPRSAVSLADLLAAIPPDAPSLLILPDAISDPQNLGAIIRAAECFGADGVILNRNRGCGITPVVTKSAVGATELVPLIEVANADHALRQCQQHNFWVVSAACGSNAEPLSRFTLPPRTLLIVGSEGDGIQPLLLKRSDHLVAIEQCGIIDSLNVSQATAILCHAYRSQNPRPE